jgi:GNAT superfamily N-acetyltransferase
MLLTIVDQVPEHVSALRHLYLEARKKAFPGLDPLELSLHDFDTVTAGEKVAVALHQEVPVGFIAWWPPDNFIHSLFVSPTLLGQGIGRSLLQYCLGHMGRPATLKCVVTNHAALAFYAAQGWKIISTGMSGNEDFLLLAYDD